MARVMLRRLAAIPLLLFIVSLVVTGMTALIPGDPAVTLAGENASPELIAQTRERLGLDESFIHQYVTWVGNALHGDFGESLFSGRPVTDQILDRLPVTASLTLGAIVVAVLIGFPLGLLAGLRRGSAADRAATGFTSLALAIPSYWLGMLLLLVFAVRFQWLPVLGYVHLSEDPWEWFKHLVLPSIALGLAASAEVARQLRSSVADVLHQDFIRAAQAKGLRHRTVTLKHILKNASAPAITVLGLQVALLLGGAVVVEQIFGIPGIGQMAVIAVVDRDIPLVQGIVVFTTLAVVVANLVVDLAYTWLNPRVRAA